MSAPAGSRTPKHQQKRDVEENVVALHFVPYHSMTPLLQCLCLTLCLVGHVQAAPPRSLDRRQTWGTDTFYTTRTTTVYV